MELAFADCSVYLYLAVRRLFCMAKTAYHWEGIGGRCRNCIKSKEVNLCIWLTCQRNRTVDIVLNKVLLNTEYSDRSDKYPRDTEYTELCHIWIY